ATQGLFQAPHLSFHQYTSLRSLQQPGVPWPHVPEELGFDAHFFLYFMLVNRFASQMIHLDIMGHAGHTHTFGCYIFAILLSYLHDDTAVSVLAFFSRFWYMRTTKIVEE
ncbi:hypothetical protein ACJX0J_031140, partial [Zea mays]